MAGRHYVALGYCDEVDIENFLLTDIDNSFSSQLEDWIASAETQVNNYLGYTTASGIFAETITSEVAKSFVDSDLNLKIFPRKTPIISVQGISLAKGTTRLPITLVNGAGVAKYNIPSTANYISYPQYEFAVTGGSIISNLSSIRGTEFYTHLSYVGGYTQVPPDIRLATVNLTSDTIMRHANKEGLSSITQGRVTKRWADRIGASSGEGAAPAGASDFVLDAFSLLRPYRISSQWL